MKEENLFRQMFNPDNPKGWELIPDEDLWQDVEMTSEEVKTYIYWQVIQQGEWKLIRRKND